MKVVGMRMIFFGFLVLRGKEEGAWRRDSNGRGREVMAGTSNRFEKPPYRKKKED